MNPQHFEKVLDSYADEVADHSDSETVVNSSTEDLPATEKTDLEKLPSVLEIPNGGLRAWLVVSGSFFLFFNSWGIINAFGTYQAYYQSNLLHGQSASTISWIGSIQSFLVAIVGVVVGPMYDAGHLRSLVITGSVLVVVGSFTLSFCNSYWQILLAQGFCIGTGSGFLYIPSVAVIPQYFSTKKAFATGVVACGSSIGGMIYPFAFRALQPKVGFGWASRVIALIALTTQLWACFIIRPLHKTTAKKRVLFEPSAFKELPYCLYCAALFSAYLGFLAPVFYISSFAIDKSFVGVNFGFYLLAILNGCSTPGRLVPAYLSGKLGPLNMFLCSTTLTAIIVLCWAAVSSAAGAITFAVLYGLASGGLMSLSAVSLNSLIPDQKKLGTRYGMVCIIGSFGSLCGTPICGALLDKTGSWLSLQLFSGLTILLTALFLYAARVARYGWDPRVTC